MSLFSVAAILALGWMLGLAAGYFLLSLGQRSRTAAARQALESATAQLAERDATAARLRDEASALGRDLAAAQSSLRSASELQARLDAELKEERLRLQKAAEEHSGLNAQLSRATEALAAERRQNAEALQRIEQQRRDAEKQAVAQFENLANRILDEKSKRFVEQNQANLGQILDPLRTRLTEFQAKVEEVQKEGIAGRSELRGHIDQLRTLNERLSQDATNLVSALRGSSKTQGDWGEFILEGLLDSCGLRKDFQYRVQESFTGEDGKRARPDVILDLPEGKHLVIDAKVSLKDYTDYCSLEEGPEREAALARHLNSVRTHMKGLSERNYQTLYGLKSLDFVVMFVPVEPAFLLAVSRDARLWSDGWNRNVLLVSPTTLLFVIRTVAQLWRQESQTRNVQEVMKRGEELYDKLAAFAKDLTSVGDSLDAARRSYDEAFRKLATGKGNAIRQAEMLKSLGVKPTKSLPPAMLDAALDVEQMQLPENTPDADTEEGIEVPLTLTGE